MRIKNWNTYMQSLTLFQNFADSCLKMTPFSWFREVTLPIEKKLRKWVRAWYTRLVGNGDRRWAHIYWPPQQNEEPPPPRWLYYSTITPFVSITMVWWLYSYAAGWVASIAALQLNLSSQHSKLHARIRSASDSVPVPAHQCVYRMHCFSQETWIHIVMIISDIVFTHPAI